MASPDLPTNLRGAMSATLSAAGHEALVIQRRLAGCTAEAGCDFNEPAIIIAVSLLAVICFVVWLWLWREGVCAEGYLLCLKYCFCCRYKRRVLVEYVKPPAVEKTEISKPKKRTPKVKRTRNKTGHEVSNAWDFNRYGGNSYNLEIEAAGAPYKDGSGTRSEPADNTGGM